MTLSWLSDIEVPMGRLQTWLYVFSLLSTGAAQTRRESLKLGFSAMSDFIPRGPPYRYGQMGSALVMALEDVNNDENILPNHTLEYILSPTDCDQKKSLAVLVQLRDQIAAMIGPSCSSAIASMGLLASYWDIPLVGFSGSDAALSNKAVYDTLVRTVSPAQKMGMVIFKVVQMFQWHRVGIVLTNIRGHLHYIQEGVQEIFTNPDANMTVNGPYLFDGAVGSSEQGRYATALKKAKQTSKSKLGREMEI